MSPVGSDVAKRLGKSSATMNDMKGLRGFSQTLQAVYDAALAPENWPEALSRIGAMFDGEGAVLFFYSGNAPADFIACPELAPAVRVYQSGGWWKRDLHAQRAIALHLGHGDVFNDEMVATPHEIETHPIYVEFFREVGFGWLMSSVLLPDLDMLICLSVPRAKAKGAFDEGEMEVLRRVGRHVEQALRVSLRLQALEAENTTLLTALDAVDACVFGLDEDGGVVFANRAAEASRANFFLGGGDRLIPQSPLERCRLDAGIAAARRASEDAAPTPCLLTGHDGRRLVVWALPATAASRPLFGDRQPVRILLYGTAAGSRTEVDPGVIRDVFDLSLGEARLASLIGAGVQVGAAAARLGVTEGTARVVLKRVFRKLGVNRQAELVLQLSQFGERAPRQAAARTRRAGKA